MYIIFRKILHVNLNIAIHIHLMKKIFFFSLTIFIVNILNPNRNKFIHHLKIVSIMDKKVFIDQNDWFDRYNVKNCFHGTI